MSRTQRHNRKTGVVERDSYHRRTHPARSCGHGGDCPWCLAGRRHAARRQRPEVLDGEWPGRLPGKRRRIG